MLSSCKDIWRLPNLDKRIIEQINQKLLSLAYAKKQCKKNSSFILSLIEDKKIAELNYNFLSCASPTNVLSFPNNKKELGIIYMSLSTVCREAKLYGQKTDSYFLFLLCHGFSHLLGYDHSLEMDEISDFFFNELQKHYPIKY